MLQLQKLHRDFQAQKSWSSSHTTGGLTNSRGRLPSTLPGGHLLPVDSTHPCSEAHQATVGMLHCFSESAGLDFPGSSRDDGPH